MESKTAKAKPRRFKITEDVKKNITGLPTLLSLFSRSANILQFIDDYEYWQYLMLLWCKATHNSFKRRSRAFLVLWKKYEDNSDFRKLRRLIFRNKGCSLKILHWKYMMKLFINWNYDGEIVNKIKNIDFIYQGWVTIQFGRSLDQYKISTHEMEEFLRAIYKSTQTSYRLIFQNTNHLNRFIIQYDK